MILPQILPQNTILSLHDIAVSLSESGGPGRT